MQGITSMTITGIAFYLIVSFGSGCAHSPRPQAQPQDQAVMTRVCPDGSTVDVKVHTGSRLTHLSLAAAKNRARIACLRKNTNAKFVSLNIKTK